MSKLWEKNKLRYWREQNGMTQEELAKQLKVSQPAIQKWEKGTREPNLQNLYDICKILNIKIEDLIKL